MNDLKRLFRGLGSLQKRNQPAFMLLCLNFRFEGTDVDTLDASPDLTVTKTDGLTTLVPGQ